MSIIKAALRTVLLFACAVVLGAGFFLAWLVYTPWGARFAVQQIVSDTLGAQNVSWDGLEGSLARGIVVRHLQVKEIPHLPAGSFLRVQMLSIRLNSLSLSGLALDIDNGRLFPHGEEAIVMNVKIRGKAFTANVYAHYLDLGDVRHVLVQFFDVPVMKGVLRDIDLLAGGAMDRPWVAGRFITERIERNGFVLEECPVRADLHFVRGSTRWETHGRLDLMGGWLQSPAVRIDILEGRLTFTGRPARPEMDIHAIARVSRTTIDMKVKGDRDNPQLILSSDEAYSKEQLLLMLATGRRWSGMESAIGGHPMTPQLTSDFVEYLLFGGSRGKVVGFFGLSDISLIAEEKVQGVSLSKDVNGRLGLGYGVKVETRPDGEAQTHDVTHVLESDYRLSDHFTVTARKEIKAGQPSGGETADWVALPDDQVFLRYRSRF